MRLLKDYASKIYPDECNQKWMGRDLIVLAVVTIIGFAAIYFLGPDVRYG